MVELFGLFPLFCYVSAPTKNISSTEAGTWAQVFTAVPYVTCPCQSHFRREPLKKRPGPTSALGGEWCWLTPPFLGLWQPFADEGRGPGCPHSLGAGLLCLPDSRGRTLQSAAVPGRPVHAGLAWPCALLMSLPRTRPNPTVTAQAQRNHLPSSGVSPAVLTSQPGSGFCS